MPMMDMTASGSTVSVAITMRIIPDTGSQKSSGYPMMITRSAVSTALRGSSIPPSSLPESV